MALVGRRSFKLSSVEISNRFLQKIFFGWRQTIFGNFRATEKLISRKFFLCVVAGSYSSHIDHPGKKISWKICEEHRKITEVRALSTFHNLCCCPGSISSCSSHMIKKCSGILSYLNTVLFKTYLDLFHLLTKTQPKLDKKCLTLVLCRNYKWVWCWCWLGWWGVGIISS